MGVFRRFTLNKKVVLLFLSILFTGPNYLPCSSFLKVTGNQWAGKERFWAEKDENLPWTQHRKRRRNVGGTCRDGLVVNGAQLENSLEKFILYVSHLHNYTFIYSVCKCVSTWIFADVCVSLLSCCNSLTTSSSSLTLLLESVLTFL